MILQFPEARPTYAVPLRLGTTLFRGRWLARCSFHVAQRTLPRAYEPSLSRRSNVCLGEGFGPTSWRNTAKESIHAGQIVIRPKYHLAYRDLGFRQRVFIAFHARYSGVIRSPLWPCFVRRSFVKQPQDFVSPLRRLLLATMRRAPQSQRHSHWASLGWKGPRRITRRRVNRSPVRSIVGRGTMSTAYHK